MTGAPPRLSVIFTVWGRYVDLLPAAVDSAISASDGLPVEIVVVDNASDVPVPTEALPKEVSIYRLPHRLSSGAARDAGALFASADLLAFADADDELLGTFLADAIAVLDGSPETALVYAPLARMDAITGEPLGTSWPNPSRIGWLTDRSRIALATACLFSNRIPVSGGAVIRAAAYRSLGGFADVPVNDDWTLSPLIPFAGKVRRLTEPGVAYRVDTVSQSRKPRPVDEHRAVREEIRSRFGTRIGAGLPARLLLIAAARHHEKTLPNPVPVTPRSPSEPQPLRSGAPITRPRRRTLF